MPSAGFYIGEIMTTLDKRLSAVAALVRQGSRLADIGTEIVYRHKHIRKPENKPLVLRKIGAVPIAVIKIFPGIQYSLFESLISKEMKGVVLEAFGAGNIPNYDDLLPVLKRAKENDVLLTVCSQCNNGNVSIGTYAASKHLKEIGAVSGHDMTTEAAVAKMYYLFSKYDDLATVKSLMETDLAGEISIEESFDSL
jgi:L-asparaginase